VDPQCNKKTTTEIAEAAIAIGKILRSNLGGVPDDRGMIQDHEEHEEHDGRRTRPIIRI
jgi:hypothetical protein